MPKKIEPIGPPEKILRSEPLVNPNGVKPLSIEEEIIISRLDPEGMRVALDKLALSISMNHVIKIFKANGRPVIYDSFNYAGEGKEINSCPTLLLRESDGNVITFFTHVLDRYWIRRVE